MPVEGDGDMAGAPIMQAGECADAGGCPPAGMIGGAGGEEAMSLGGMAGMPEANQAGAGGDGGAPPIEVGPICGDGVVDADEKCDDRGTEPGDGCNATCRTESGWLCDGGEPTRCTSICGDGIVVSAEAEAGGCDDHNGAALDGCSVTCKVEAGYVCSGAPSVCAKTCGDGKLDPGEACDDKNAASGDGCTACAIESGFSCDSSVPPSKCSDINECTTNTDNCAAKAACTNTTGGFSCKCNSGYSGNGVTCADIDECAGNTDNCNTNATCTNTAGSFSCACKNGYWGTGVSCTANPSITSFTADYSRVCSGGTVTFSATYKNGTGTIDHSVGSIVSGKTAVSGAIAASTVFKLTVSAAGGTPATAQVTVDTIAHGTFALTRNPSGMVGPFTDAQVVKLKDGRVLVFGSSSTTGQGSAKIFDARNETFVATTLSSGPSPALALLNDGRVLVTTGDDTTTAKVYDPVSNTSVATGGLMVQERSPAPGLSLTNGKVLIPGGLLVVEATLSILKTSELYDPTAVANGSFSAGPDMNVAHYVGGIGLLPNSHKILLAGGCSAVAVDGPSCTAVTASGDLYDPTVGKAGAFLKTGVMSTPRLAPVTAALADDRVLIAGGFTTADPADKTTVQTAELYDPQGGDPQNGIFGAFQATGAMITARSYASATLLKSGKVLIAGGWTGTDRLKASELYDPATGKFTSTGDLNYARAVHKGVLLDNGMVLIGPDGTELYCQ